MIQRPDLLNLSNWRQSPYSQWSFHHVREVVQTENIPAVRETVADWPVAEHRLEQLAFEGVDAETWSLDRIVEFSLDGFQYQEIRTAK